MPTNLGRNIDSLLDEFNKHASELEVQALEQQHNHQSTKETPEQTYQLMKSQWFFHPSSYYMRDVDRYDGQGCNPTTGCMESCEFYPDNGRMEIRDDGSSYTVTYIDNSHNNNNKSTADKDDVNKPIDSPATDVTTTTNRDCCCTASVETNNDIIADSTQQQQQDEGEENGKQSSPTTTIVMGPITGVKLSTNTFGELTGETKYSTRFGPEDRLCITCGRELNVHNPTNQCVGCRRLFRRL